MLTPLVLLDANTMPYDCGTQRVHGKAGGRREGRLRRTP
jgi:hypothetical protein